MFKLKYEKYLSSKLRTVGINSSSVVAILGALLSGFLFWQLLLQASMILNGKAFVFSMTWVEALGIDLSFFVDGLSLLFGLIITGIGVLIFIYSSAYFYKHEQGIRINLILVLFMLTMLGIVVADNLITMFVFWELTTFSSYLLIGTKNNSAEARKSALQVLIVTGAGGIALLAGLILFGMATETYQISEIIKHRFVNETLYVPVFILIVIGCFTKSAQFPFHFWLPNAMAAPTPISAYLHSATMVKAGIYFLARLSPSLGDTKLWFWTLFVVGGITAVWSSILAIRQTDIKLMIAYTTLIALGILTFLLGIGTEIAITAALTFLLVHALYKSTLFLVVGNIESVTGTRDWRQLGKLRKIMPITTIAAFLAVLSMAGVPPLFGFISKELIYEAAINASSYSNIAIIIVSLSASLVAAVAFFFISTIFFKKSLVNPDEQSSYKKIPFAMVFPPFILAVIGALYGLFPNFLAQPLIHEAINSIGLLTSVLYLKIWHGFGLALYLSLVSLILGLIVAWKFYLIHKYVDRLLNLITISCEGGYNLIMSTILDFAAFQTRKLQSGKQRFYIAIAFTTLSLLVLTTMLQPGFFAEVKWVAVAKELYSVPLYQLAISLLIAISILVTVLSNSKLLAICAIGVMGTGIALLFTIFSAPDVAMTQFMIEILVVIIVTMAIIRLPPFIGEGHGEIYGNIRDSVLACTVGSIVALLMLIVNFVPFNYEITEFYQAHSYVSAHGRNIVNVILVDFRGLDTLGEILVIAMSGFACFALIKLKAGNNKK